MPESAFGGTLCDYTKFVHRFQLGLTKCACMDGLRRLIATFVTQRMLSSFIAAA